MTDRLSHFSNIYFAYLNYSRPSASMGTNTFHSGSSRITDKFDMRHKWQILAIASCVVIAVTLGIGIYSATLYQNSSTATTDTTTTAVTTSRATTAASTADSGNTVSSTTTTAIPTVAGDTTSAAVSTEVVTTMTPPICPSMLPFGDEAGDVYSANDINVSFSCILWNIKADDGYIYGFPSNGLIWLKSDANKESLEIRTINDPVTDEDWSAYYRNVSSKAEKDAIACLVQNNQPVKAFVATVANNDMTELQAYQLIIASFGPSGTYIIRIYSKKVPDSGSDDPVLIYFSAPGTHVMYFSEDKVQDVAGRRQIFDVSKAIGKDQNLTVIEEGKNCDVFIC